MSIPVAASGGREAINKAGLAVNHLDLSTPGQIRKAIPAARQAARALKSWSESRDHNSGDFTGLPKAIFQNWLYEQNREWHLTDGTLCVLWSVEFPSATCDYPEKHRYIASTRTAYNKGRHQADAPPVPCVGYDRSGQPLASGRSTAPPSRAPNPTAPATTPATDPPRPLAAGQLVPAPRLSGRNLPLPPGHDTAWGLSSDPAATCRRVEALDRYMADAVMDDSRFRCSDYAACRDSHRGKFFEGQSHHVGRHYDLALNGGPFRIAVVGQEYGNAPAMVSRETRTNDVVVLTGQRKRFSGEVHTHRGIRI